MSLHDVDKNTNQRRESVLNSHDEIIQRRAQGTASFNPITDETSQTGVGPGVPKLIASGDIVVNVPLSHIAGNTYDNTIDITISDYTFDSSNPTTTLEVLVYVTTPYTDPSGVPKTSTVPYLETSWNSGTNRIEITTQTFAYASPSRKAGSVFGNPFTLRCAVVPGSSSSLEGNWVFTYYAYRHNISS